MPDTRNYDSHQDGGTRRDNLVPAESFIIGLGTMILAAHMSGVTAVFPLLAEKLGISVVRGQWILTAYTLALTGCLLVSGGLADRFGLKRIYIAGMAVFGISSGACALASGPLVLILLRAIEGCGAAMVSATSVALIGANVARRRLGSALGWQTGITYVGLTAGPILAGFLMQRLGWRALFAVNLPVAAAAVVLAARLPVEPVFEQRASRTLVRLRTCAATRIARAVTDESVFYFCLHAIGFLIPVYLTRVRVLSAMEAGILIALQNAARAITAPFSGGLCDYIGERAIVLSGAMCLIASACAMYFFRADSPLAAVAPALILLGVGAGLFAPANSKSLLSAAHPERYGAAAGMLATARNLGMAGGVAVAALLYAQFGSAAEAFAIVAAMAIVYTALRLSILNRYTRRAPRLLIPHQTRLAPRVPAPPSSESRFQGEPNNAFADSLLHR